MPFFRYPFFYNPNYYNSRFNNPRMYETTDNRVSALNQYGSNGIYSNKNQSENNGVNNNDMSNPVNESSKNSDNRAFGSDKKNNSNSNCGDDNYFFELFGLKLYFDDILLICLLFFLYQEGVKDDELFLSLVLLLLS